MAVRWLIFVDGESGRLYFSNRVDGHNRWATSWDRACMFFDEDEAVRYGIAYIDACGRFQVDEIEYTWA